MDQRTIGLLAAQGGVATRRQLLAAGMESRDLARRLAGGDLHQVRHGVYCAGATWEQAVHWHERQALVDRAASLWTTRPHVLSHDSAALRLGMQVLEQDGRTHLTHRGRRGTHTRSDITHHHAPYEDDDLSDDGTHLRAARTALDIAREHGVRAGTVAVDSALRIGATYADLHRVLAGMRHWPGRRAAASAIELSDPDTDSIGETLARELVEELGHGRPRTQFGIAADGRVVWCDLVLGRHVFEFSGRLKFQAVGEGGVAVDPAAALFEEKKRQDWLTGFKLGVSGIFWEDFWGARRDVARERLRREYLHTVERFGTDRSDLDRFRPRMPRKRPRTPDAA